jgi:hypothetical protein
MTKLRAICIMTTAVLLLGSLVCLALAIPDIGNAGAALLRWAVEEMR